MSPPNRNNPFHLPNGFLHLLSPWLFFSVVLISIQLVRGTKRAENELQGSGFGDFENNRAGSSRSLFRKKGRCLLHTYVHQIIAHFNGFQYHICKLLILRFDRETRVRCFAGILTGGWIQGGIPDLTLKLICPVGYSNQSQFFFCLPRFVTFRVRGFDAEVEHQVTKFSKSM
jgi:hypothetical protein